jgi:hypothetical protein
MTSMVSLLIRRWGNKEIQDRFLPKLEHPGMQDSALLFLDYLCYYIIVLCFV